MLKYIITFSLLLTGASAMSADNVDYLKIIKAIAIDIEKLKDEYPQLSEYTMMTALNEEQMTIEYAYRTHQPQGFGGWTSRVPNPNEDGIWFYLDIHDSDSTRQIHTQPIVPTIKVGNKVCMLLLLEGKQTKSVHHIFWEIINKHIDERSN